MIRVRVQLDGEHVCFSVEDNGVGIEQDKLEKNSGVSWKNLKKVTD